MLKPSDLTKAELLQVVEMLAMKTGPYYLDRALSELDKAQAAGREWSRRMESN